MNQHCFQCSGRGMVPFWEKKGRLQAWYKCNAVCSCVNGEKYRDPGRETYSEVLARESKGAEIVWGDEQPEVGV